MEMCKQLFCHASFVYIDDRNHRFETDQLILSFIWNFRQLITSHYRELSGILKEATLI